MCMSVCLSVCLHLSGTTLEASHKRSVHVACGLGSVHVVTRYVLPVLWMTSCLPVIGQANSTTQSNSPKAEVKVKVKVRVRPMSHLRFYRAMIKSRDFIAR